MSSVAIIWSADAAESVTTLAESRLARVADALARNGIASEGVPYSDETVAQVRERLKRFDGVLVWVNPVEQGRDRAELDQLLREVADIGLMVSTHPDVIDKLGTKDVLYSTRAMDWGCDTHRYPDAQALRTALPASLARHGPRVLKHSRGNGGEGVWKVELVAQDGDVEQRVRVRHARRGSQERVMPLAEFIVGFDCHFTAGGSVIDQPYQPRLVDGMVRCYLVRDKVVGFGEQLINALYPAADPASSSGPPQPGPRLYYPPGRPDFQGLRTRMEAEWVPQLCDTLDLQHEELPVIWDADFLYGPKSAEGADTYVLCEINVSCVFPFPDDALERIGEEVQKRLARRVERI